MLSYLTLIVLATFLIGYFSYMKATQIVEEQVGATFKQALHQAAINITYRLEEVENVSELILTHSRLQPILKRAQSGYGDTTTVQLLNDFQDLIGIISNLENNRNIYRIRLFVPGDSLYSRENNNIFRMQDLDSELIQQIMDTNGHILWKSTYEQEYLPSNKQEVISLFRTINDLRNLKTVLGVVAIDIQEDVLNGVFKDVNFSENGAIFVYNNGERITSFTSAAISDYAESDVMDKILNASPSEELPIIQLGETDYFTIFQEVEYSGWEIAALVPVQEIRAKSQIIGKFTGLIGLLVISLATLSAALLANQLTRGLRTLVVHMQDVRHGSYGQLIRVTGNDEISGLQSQYNSMVLRIRELIETVYLMGVRKQAAELTALESQIKPHFLYNTLDTLKWMGMKIKADHMVSLVDSLSKFFRLGLNRGQELTTVVNELGHVQAFMNIQDIRFSEKLSYWYEVDSELLSCRITKLILQPIVENAVLHGIQQKEDHSGTVIVRVYADNAHYVFDVIDDGVGMTRKQQAILLQEDRGGGYGAKNVHQRIRLYYGDNYGVECFSRLGIGTCIRIRLPMVKSELHGSGRLHL
ncbi:hypothetical protein BK133_27415 [Paenibacillus sp. FSL H8-0548]|uniref:sensor histidine kinase n=1 Tax=Paenibacillus sp. FSL H8-0548 TaxID=1920422 RepID=UPI00096EE6CB|nr:sensor histidine kinase [Paenibacillus sp. FSL H8-0548]OMF21955.1 hypothetical protein BK133_27415 [Paenibacillus sp. FSL H8-0548]